jgi:hypothetical protein
MKHIVLVSHEVKNFADWKVGFDAHNSAREANGVRVIDVLVDAKNPNMVTALLEASDLEKLNAMFNSPDLKAAMEKGGVISAPEIKVLISKN